MWTIIITLYIIKFKSFVRTFSSFSPFFRVFSRGEHKAIAHKVDKLTTVLYSPFPEVPSIRPKKNLSYSGVGGEGV